LAEFAERPVLGILQFCGPRRLAELERELALEIARECGAAMAASDAPYRHWQAHRYESYSAKWQNSGHWMDTIEVTLPWRSLVKAHVAMRDVTLALCEGMHFGAHWSHAYPEGACQYMTLRLPPMERERALRLHRQAWDVIERMTVEHGGSIAHHHGAGLFRNPYMAAELGSAGLALLQAVKDAVDPRNILNPGKLGLRPRPGAASVNEASA
jgi:alkyldihydroxyacetonephosphate synthase